MEFEDDTTSTEEPRLPSTRPIDRRWDRSRGIIFGNALRNLHADHSWSANAPIVFGPTPTPRRGYANRNLFTPKPTGQKGDPGPARDSVMDSHKPLSSSDFGGGQLLHDLKREQDAHKATKLRTEKDMQDLRRSHAAEVNELRETSAVEIAEIRGVVDEQKQQLADQLKALENERQEAARQFAKRDRALKKGEDDLRAGLTQLETTIAQAQREANDTAHQNVKRLMESAVERENQASADAATYQKQVGEVIDRLTQEYMDDLREHKNALDQANLAEMPEIREAGLHRDNVERADYEAYHRVWDEIGDSARKYLGEIVKTNALLFKKADRWSDIAKSFDGAKIDPWFPHTYPKLNQHLHEFLQMKAREAMDSAQALKGEKDAVFDAMDELSRQAHTSRMLTRYHKFEATTNEYMTSTMVNILLNEKPLRRRLEILERQRKQIDQQIRLHPNSSAKDTMQQKLQFNLSQRVIILNVLRFFITLREVESLEALQRDTIAEKAIFLVTEKARLLQEQAWTDWSKYTTANPITSEDREISEEQQQRNRKEWRQKYKEARVEQDALMDLMRKRRLLEVYLGETMNNEAEYDAEIDKSLTRARSEMEAALEKLVRGGAGGRTRQFVPIQPIAGLPGPSTGATIQLESEGQVKAIKSRLQDPKGYPTNEDKQKDEQKLLQLKLEINRAMIASLSTKRAEVLRKSPVDHAAALHLQKEIERKSEAVARAEGGKESPTESLLTDATAATTTARSSVAGTLPNPESKVRDSSPTGRPSGHRRKARRAASPIRKVGSGSTTATSFNQNKRASVEKVLNFKPTVSQQAPHQRWSAGLRSFHTGNINQNGATSTPPSSKNSYSWFEDHASLSQAMAQLSMESESTRADTDGLPRVEADANLYSEFFSTENEPHGLPSKTEDPEWTSEGGADSDLNLVSNYSSDQAASLEPASEAPTIMETESSDESNSDSGQSQESNTNFQFTYNISSQDYRDAVIASKSTNAAFWTFRLYRNANGKPPKTLYCTNYEQAEARANEFLNEPVIGFDIEWEPWANLAKSTPKQNISLIQIAAEDKIGLFHLALFNGETAENLLPPSLRTILESRAIIKAGVNIAGDGNRLKKCLDVDMKGLFELSHLYRVVELSTSAPHQVNKRLVGLAEQVQKVLGLPLKKDEVRTSAWSKKLQLEQTDYAASDAYAGFRLYHELEMRRRKMDPMPPRPAFWEEHKPIVLGNGKLIVPRPYPSKRKLDVSDNEEKVIQEDDDECEEYFEAVENLDVESSSQESSESFSSSNDSQFYMSAPEGSQDAGNESQVLSHVQKASAQGDFSYSDKAHGHCKSTKPCPPHPPEVVRAEHWVTNWRASLPAEYNLKVTTPTLRAYHMWHAQGLDCTAVAALLRHPPLSLQTVASYVMTALKEENLPYDKDRVQEPLGILPKSVHGKYQKVLDRMKARA